MNRSRTRQIILIFFLVVISLLLATLSFFLLFNSGIVTTEKSKVSDWFSAIISSFAFVSGGYAVYLAYRSFRFTQNAEEGNIYLTMMQRYHDGKMVTALKELSRFKKKYADIEEGFEYWLKNRNTEDVNSEAYKIEKARHIVKYFYRDLMQMVQANYFSRQLAKRICNTAGRHIFKEIVIPMDKKMNPFSFVGEYDPFDDIFEELKNEQNK